MTATKEEILANMLTFTTIRRKASALRTTLDELKAEIADYMKAHPDDTLDRGDGCAATWRSKQNRTVNPARLTHDVLIDAAAEGLLTLSITALDELANDTLKEVLTRYVEVLPAEPYVDISSPTWGAAKAATSIKKDYGGATAQVPAPLPLKPARQRQTQHKPAPAGQWTCPDHPDRTPKLGKNSAYLFCTGKDAWGGWCKLTSQNAAA